MPFDFFYFKNSVQKKFTFLISGCLIRNLSDTDVFIRKYTYKHYKARSKYIEISLKSFENISN